MPTEESRNRLHTTTQLQGILNEDEQVLEIMHQHGIQFGRAIEGKDSTLDIRMRGWKIDRKTAAPVFRIEVGVGNIETMTKGLIRNLLTYFSVPVDKNVLKNLQAKDLSDSDESEPTRVFSFVRDYEGPHQLLLEDFATEYPSPSDENGDVNNEDRSRLLKQWIDHKETVSNVIRLRKVIAYCYNYTEEKFYIISEINDESEAKRMTFNDSLQKMVIAGLITEMLEKPDVMKRVRFDLNNTEAEDMEGIELTGDLDDDAEIRVGTGSGHGDPSESEQGYNPDYWNTYVPDEWNSPLHRQKLLLTTNINGLPIDAGFEASILAEKIEGALQYIEPKDGITVLIEPIDRTCEQDRVGSREWKIRCFQIVDGHDDHECTT